MPSFTQGDLEQIAGRILAMDPDSVPRFRLLRDVLGLNPADTAYQSAREDLQRSRWVALLESSQLPDGTWGRFHTQDRRVKQPFPTTEAAIAVALDSGLDKQSPILQRVLPALLDYVEGRAIWPDRQEKHDNPLAWYVWVRHFSAATLALIDSHHASLDEFWRLWAEVLQAAFHSGAYDRQSEIAALDSLLGCRMRNPVPFHNRYPLLILSATSNRLPADLERMALEFVWHSPAGIYYVYDRDISAPPAIHSRGFWGWFRAQQLLSRFRLWKELAVDAVDWIWAQRTSEGFWDPGSRVGRKPYTSFPLSESWRRRGNRVIDCTVEVLALLSKSLR